MQKEIKKLPFFDQSIRYNPEINMYCATDLVRIGNARRLKAGKALFNITRYFNKKRTKDLIKILKTDEYLIKGRGRNAETWVRKELFLDMALSIDTKIAIKANDYIINRK